MATLRSPVIVEEEASRSVVECPGLQGCFAQGDTYEEALEDIRDLIHVHLERMTPRASRPSNGMTPKLPGAKPRKVIKALKALGFRSERQSRGHMIFVHPDGRVIPSPFGSDRDIKPGLTR